MKEINTPLQAIRAKCLDCANNNEEEVRKCPITNCALFKYRSGKLVDENKVKERIAKAKATRLKNKENNNGLL